VADARVPDSWRFIVMTSGIRADKTGTVRDRYNSAAIAAQTLRDEFEARTGRRVPSLAAALESSPEAAARLRDGLTPEQTHRLDHFAAENQRVLDALAAFERGDEDAIGAIAAASQADAARLLGNQIDETTRLAALAREAGAFAATSFGAGFGGSVWALVDRGDAAIFARAWLDAYRRQQPDMQNVRWFVAQPGPGLTALPVDKI
jgi:galactokinase